MRHSTTSFPLLNDESYLGIASWISSYPAGVAAFKQRSGASPRAVHAHR
jgi:hypothetical protein